MSSPRANPVPTSGATSLSCDVPTVALTVASVARLASEPPLGVNPPPGTDTVSFEPAVPFVSVEIVDPNDGVFAKVELPNVGGAPKLNPPVVEVAPELVGAPKLNPVPPAVGFEGAAKLNPDDVDPEVPVPPKSEEPLVEVVEFAGVAPEPSVLLKENGALTFGGDVNGLGAAAPPDFDGEPNEKPLEADLGGSAKENDADAALVVAGGSAKENGAFVASEEDDAGGFAPMPNLNGLSAAGAGAVPFFTAHGFAIPKGELEMGATGG